jgi:hypothetical protein
MNWGGDEEQQMLFLPSVFSAYFFHLRKPKKVETVFRLLSESFIFPKRPFLSIQLHVYRLMSFSIDLLSHSLAVPAKATNMSSSCGVNHSTFLAILPPPYVREPQKLSPDFLRLPFPPPLGLILFPNLFPSLCSPDDVARPRGLSMHEPAVRLPPHRKGSKGTEGLKCTAGGVHN